MKALQKKQAAIATKQEKKATATLKKLRKGQPQGGSGIKIFGSDKNPISLELEKSAKGGWYPTTNALTNLLNTYEPLKDYMPGIPEVMVEKSTGKGVRNDALFVAYRNANQTAESGFVKGKPLFFLKISRADLQGIPKKLEELQKGPVGRFGLKAMSNRELPIIVLQEMFFIYRGQDNKNHTIEVMHIAHGKQLSAIIDSHDQNDQQWAEKVGKALGLFHLEFMKYNNSSSPMDWKTMTHGDFHLGNVFFDEKTSRVYFIDNVGMSIENPFEDLKFLIDLTIHGFSDWNKDSRTVNFVLYFIKGYLSAYPLDKRKSVVTDLKEELNFNQNYQWAANRPEKQVFIGKFIDKLNAVFTQASKQ